MTHLKKSWRIVRFFVSPPLFTAPLVSSRGFFVLASKAIIASSIRFLLSFLLLLFLSVCLSLSSISCSVLPIPPSSTLPTPPLTAPSISSLLFSVFSRPTISLSISIRLFALSSLSSYSNTGHELLIVDFYHCPLTSKPVT